MPYYARIKKNFLCAGKHFKADCCNRCFFYLAHHYIVDNSLDKHPKEETFYQRRMSLMVEQFSNSLLKQL